MKKLKITYLQFTIMIMASLIVLFFCWALTINWNLYGDYYEDSVLRYGFFHCALNVLFVCSIVGYLIWLCIVMIDNTSDYIELIPRDTYIANTKPLRWKKILTYTGIILFGLIGYNICKSMAIVYNTSVLYQNSYIQKEQEKIGFYDKMWKTYMQKNEICEMNKETFIQIAIIIMENRADGAGLAWKWVQENQKIPFEEFTKFYSDLTVYIESQREQYFDIDKKCQEIAKQNNTMLDTFPNNIYNKILKCEHINFEYSFLSDDTRGVFKYKTENLK